MTRYLVATATRATTEAACDYLEPKLSAGDEVYLLAVAEEAAVDPGVEAARSRLGVVATLRAVRREGRPEVAIVGAVGEYDVDEVVLGPRRGGRPSSLGTTTKAVLAAVDRPVFVVPGGRGQTGG